MWPYYGPPQGSPGDIIVQKIMEEWWEKNKKSKDKDDDKDKSKLPKFGVLEIWFAYMLSTPFIVVTWYVIGWGWSRIFP